MSSSYSPPPGAALTGISGTSPITYNSGTGAIGLTTVPISLGGSGATTALGAADAIGVNVFPAPGGSGSAETLYSSITPAYEGQLGVSFYGDKRPFLYFGGSAVAGDWLYAFNFPAGINQIGSSDHGDPGIFECIVHLNGSATGYARSGDSLLVVENWSTNTNNSGAGIGVAVMSGTSGKATLVDRVGCAFNHVPVGRITQLLPGNAMLVFNHSSNLKGFSVCSPTMTHGFGGDTGNFSIAYFDFTNKLFRIPKWITGKYQPSDSGWDDVFKVSPETGKVDIIYGLLTITNTPGISLGDQGRLVSFGSGNGEVVMVNGTGATAFAYFDSGFGMRLALAGQGIQIKEGSNATSGTLILNGATGVTVSTTKVTASSRIQLTINAPGGTPSGAIWVDSRIAGTSFTVKSIALDTSTVAWLIVEPSP